ncbi:MAG TPA: aspartyl protease family protein [Holophaga sp.]|nr:aspartyl protease family protein [Holophaga sp.]
MPLIWRSLLAAGLALGLGLSARAEVRPTGSITPLEVDENGLLIVKVRLSSRKPGVADREFRFIFDTGASLNVVDASVPSEFLWEEPEKPKGASSSVGDYTGARIATRIVCLKRLEIAGMVREDLMAYRMDLKGTLLGSLQDEPVDGILGMNFLRGTRFVLDPVAREVRWWHSLPGHRIPLAYTGSDHPALQVKIGGTEVPCTLDTGANGGIQVPGEIGASDSSEPFLFSGASGEVKEGRAVKMGRLECGGKAWVDIPLEVVKPGEGSPNIGREVLWAAPMELDFIDQWATFTLDARGHLPYRKAPSRVVLRWERRPDGQRLRVGPVNPGSRWAKAGLMAGDEVLSVGTLEGSALTLRAVAALQERGPALAWRIRREGVERVVQVSAAEGFVP